MEQGQQSRQRIGENYVACDDEYKGTARDGIWRVADASWKERKRYLVVLGRAEVMRRLQTPLGL